MRTITESTVLYIIAKIPVKIGLNESSSPYSAGGGSDLNHTKDEDIETDKSSFLRNSNKSWNALPSSLQVVPISSSCLIQTTLWTSFIYIIAPLDLFTWHLRSIWFKFLTYRVQPISSQTPIFLNFLNFEHWVTDPESQAHHRARVHPSPDSSDGTYSVNLLRHPTRITQTVQN